MLYYMGDSQHNENIQINKVIGESEKYVIYFTQKPIHMEFFANPIERCSELLLFNLF